jgi:hypothetical protein
MYILPLYVSLSFCPRAYTLFIVDDENREAEYVCIYVYIYSYEAIF